MAGEHQNPPLSIRVGDPLLKIQGVGDLLLKIQGAGDLLLRIRGAGDLWINPPVVPGLPRRPLPKLLLPGGNLSSLPLSRTLGDLPQNQPTGELLQNPLVPGDLQSLRPQAHLLGELLLSNNSLPLHRPLPGDNLSSLPRWLESTTLPHLNRSNPQLLPQLLPSRWISL